MTMKKTLFGISLALSIGTAQAQQLSIGTMGQGTTGYSMGAAIASVLSENGYNVRVQPSSGTTAYLPMLESGELDFGITNIIETQAALQGKDAFEGHKLGKVNIASILFPFRVGIFVRDDSDIKTLSDLKGKRLPHGYTSQRALASLVDALLANGGLTPADVEKVLVPNVVRGAEDFVAGRADAAFFAIGSGKVSEADASVGGVRFLPLSKDIENITAMHGMVPDTYVTTVEPASGLAGIPWPTPSMAYDYVLLAGDHVPEDTVAEVVKLLNKSKEQLAASVTGFSRWDTRRMYIKTNAPYHPGAKKALRELGQFPKEKAGDTESGD